MLTIYCVVFVVIVYIEHSKSLQVLELGMNFLTADDMSAILAVKLRRRLGFGMWAKLHITGMHIEGKVCTLLATSFAKYIKKRLNVTTLGCNRKFFIFCELELHKTP